MVKTMAKLHMAHASTHGARKPSGPKVHNVRRGLGSLEFECNYFLVKIPIASFEYHVRHTCFDRKQVE